MGLSKRDSGDPFSQWAQTEKEKVSQSAGNGNTGGGNPFYDYANVKKKNGTAESGNNSVDVAPVSSPTPSQSQENDNPFTFDPYKADESSLDVVEQNNLRKKLPVPTVFTPETKQKAIDEIIAERKIPERQYTNAVDFVKQDMDNAPDIVSELGVHTDKLKQQVLESDPTNNIDITTYVKQRTKQLNTQIQAANNDYSIAYSNATAGTGSTSKENWDKIDAYKEQANKLKQYKNTLEKYSTQILKSQVVKNTPPPQNASPEAMKDYFRDIGVGVNAIDNPDYTEKKSSSVKDGLDKNRNQEIVQLEDYRAASQGLDAIKNTLDVKLGLGELSKEDYANQLDQVKANRDKLYEFYPKAKGIAEYQAIGQELEKVRTLTDAAEPSMFGSLFHNVISSGYSDEQIKVVAESFGKTEDEIKDIINKKDDIPGTSFLGNVYNKFIAHGAQEIVDPLRSLIDNGRLRTDAEIENTTYSRDKQFQLNEGQQFDAPQTIIDTKKTIIDENGKKIPNPNYLQEINNPNEGNHNWGYGALNRVGDAVGGLGKLLVTTEATGGLGDIAFGGKVGAEVAGVGKDLQEVAKFSQQQKNLFGNVVGLTLTGYNENKNQGKDAGMDDEAANFYALTRGMETGLIFGLGFSPQKLLNKALGAEEKQAAKDFAEMIPKNGIEGLDKSKWADFLKNNLAVKLGVEGLTENAKASATMAIDQAVGFATQSMFAPQSVVKRNLGNELLDEGIKNFLTFAPISFLGAAVSSLKNPHESQSQIEQEAIYRMGQTPERYRDYANQQATDGKIGQQDANKRIQLVETMSTIIRSGILPKELSRSEKVEYSNNLLHAYALDEQINNKDIKIPPEQIAIKEKQIEDLKNRRGEILKNSKGVETTDSGKPLINNEKTAPTPETFTIDNKPSTKTEVEDILKGGRTEADKFDIQYNGSDEALHKQIQDVGGTTENNVTTSPKSRETVLNEGVSDLYSRLEDKAPAHYLDPLDKQKSIEGLTNQVLENPNDIKNDVGKKLAVELISRNSTEDINKSIDKWQTIADKTGENVDEQKKKEANRHIELLNAGLEEKAKIHEAAKSEPIQQSSTVSSDALKDVESTAKALEAFRWDDPKIEKITELSPNIYGDYEALAEDYHQFKKEGTNKEFVAAVEQTLTPKQESKAVAANKSENKPIQSKEQNVENISSSKTENNESKNAQSEGSSQSESTGSQKSSESSSEESKQSGLLKEPPPQGNEKAPADEGEPNISSIQNSIVDKEREKRGLQPAMEVAQKEFGQSFDDAMKVLNDNPNAGADLVEELKKKTRPITDVENALLLHRQITLQNAYEKTNEAINKGAEKKDEASIVENKLKLAGLSDALQDIYNVGKSAGTELGRGLSARRMLAKEDFSLASMETQKRAANNGRELNEEEKKKLQDLHDRIKELEDKVQKLEEENSVPKPPKNKSKKTDEDFKKERKNIFDSIKDKLKKARGETNVTPIPYAKELFTIAPDVAKLVKSLVEQGITKLDEIIDHIHDNIKDAIPGLRKEDVKDIITGKYDSPKQLRVPSPEEIKAKAELLRNKMNFRAELEKDRKANAGLLEKGLNTFIKWERAFKLSSPLTLAKLTMAALYRTASTPLEEVIGAGYTALLPKSITKGAYREAGFNAKAEARALTKMFTQGMKDAYATINFKKGGRSDLEVMYGKEGKLPPEAADFLGHLHGALKAPLKRAEFERSMEKRTANMIDAGIDVSDPLVQVSIAAEAYKDAQRTIFMQDNAVATFWQRHIVGNPKSDLGKARAAIANFLVPFVKIPTNIVGETVTYTAGLAIGTGKLAHVMIKGIENATPEQKDSILRALKKGSIGAAFLLIGYANPQAVGGYYTGKRKDQDVLAGGLRIFGHDIPQWLVHNPLMETLQIGATIRRVSDTYVGRTEEKQGLAQGILEAGLGLSEEIPFVNQGANVTKLFGSEHDRSAFLGEMAKNTLIPAAVQFAAKYTDSDVKRKPETIGEHIKMGIPGLRQQVSAKHSYSDDDYKKPAFQYFTNKGMELPYSSEKSIKIKDENTGTIKTLSDYPDKVKDEYYDTRKKYFEEELKSIEDNGVVYYNKYGEISTKPSNDKSESVNLEDLSRLQLAQVLSIASRKAAEKTKIDLFYNHNK